MARIVRFFEYGGPDVLKIEDVDVPLPAAGEVRIRVRAFGLNRAELLYRMGRYEPATFPSRIGYEAAGLVDAIGEGVEDFSTGDAVSLVPHYSQNRWGTYGELTNIDARFVVKHPRCLSFEEAGAAWMQYLTAYGGLIDIADVGRGDYVVITAASSSVGIAAIQVARQVGAIPIAVTRTRAKRPGLLAQGAAHVIASDEEDIAAGVKEITNGKGARLIFDAVAGDLVAALLDCLSDRGILLIYGALAGATLSFSVWPLLAKKAAVRGYTLHEISLDPARLAKATTFVAHGLATARLKPLIARTFTLDQVVEAHQYMESNTHMGKVVVSV